MESQRTSHIFLLEIRQVIQISTSQFLKARSGLWVIIAELAVIHVCIKMMSIMEWFQLRR